MNQAEPGLDNLECTQLLWKQLGTSQHTDQVYIMELGFNETWDGMAVQTPPH